jgi:hypothetical protein
VPPTQPQVFSNISPAQYAALIHKANQAGLGLIGNSGTTSKLGVDVAWEYSPDANRLTIQCLSAPFFMSAYTVNAKIRALVQESVG